MWMPGRYYTNVFDGIKRFFKLLVQRRRQNKMGLNENEQYHWEQIHKITESQEPLPPDKRYCSNIPKNAKSIRPREHNLELRICCTKPHIYGLAHIYAARKDSDITALATASVKSGIQKTTREDAECYYVDTMHAVADWLKEVRAISGYGQGGMARMAFNTCGYKNIFVKIQYEDDCIWYVDSAAYK